MNIFTSKNRIVDSLSVPVCCMSLFAVILGALSFFSPVDFSFFETAFSFASSVLIAAFIASCVSRDSKVTAVLSSGILCFELVFYAFSERALGVGLSVFVSFAFVKYLSKLDMKYLVLLSVFCGALLGAAFGFACPLVEKGIRALALAVKGNAFAFGALNDVFTLLFGNFFSDLFYHTDYGAATVLDNKLLVGAVNVFEYAVDEPHSSAAAYLTGRYYANIFIPVGIYAALFKKIKSRFSTPLFLATAVSAFLGNNVLFLIFVLFYNPFLFIAFSLSNALACLGSALSDVRVGFVNNASLFGMFKYMNSPLYFFSVGAVCCALAYFVSRFVLEKYDFDTYKFVPPSVKKLFDALGGEDNIEKLDTDAVIVYNPNLVNILKIDCDICENRITLNDDDLNTLSEYIIKK